MLEDHTNTYKNNTTNRGYCRDYFKYENMIIVNTYGVWAFQSEGRTTKDLPAAASPQKKWSPPFSRSFTCGMVSRDTGSFEIEFSAIKLWQQKKEQQRVCEAGCRSMVEVN